MNLQGREIVFTLREQTLHHSCVCKNTMRADLCNWDRCSHNITKYPCRKV